VSGRQRDHDADFTAFVHVQGVSLRRIAFLMCGDWHRAEDLTQEALARIYVAWPRLRDTTQLGAYARTIVVRLVIDASRRSRETPVGDVPEGAYSPVAHDQRDVILAALASMPHRQRAVLVLRYWEDFSVAQTAKALGCAEGTVKSQAARGLAALRELLPAREDLL
jgi:RNA polymerase sigma-70 factor (sigma-E family)